MASSTIDTIAIVGAGGQVGTFITKSLLAKGNKKIIAITRINSDSKIPEGVEVRKVDYENTSSLVHAMHGAQVLIITMSVMAPPESQYKLIDAAVEAGVSWILPNEYGGDPHEIELGNDTMLGEGRAKVRDYIDKVGGGKTAWIGIICSFWYEYSIATHPWLYGFDFESKTATFYDEGKVKIDSSTWPLVGQAVANLLDLPIEGHQQSPCLNDYKRDFVFISSFVVSQKDMLGSIERVTGDKWTVKYEPSKERYEEGKRVMFQEGNRMGFGKLLYARAFYDDGACNFSSRRTLANEALGLPKEDMDESTKVAIGMVKQRA